MMSLSQIGEYTILNIKVPHISSFSESTLHTIYIRPHAPKIPTEDDSRSLFLVNVPVDSTAAHLRSVFQSLIGAGRFVSATFENESLAQDSSKDPNPSVQNGKKRKRENDPDEQTHQDLPLVWDRRLRRSGSSAVVVLVDVKSMEKTLKVIKKMHNLRISSKDTNLDWPVWSNGISNVPSLGSARYLTHQKMCFPNKHELQLNIDAYMSNFNLREETQREQKQKAKNIPDADGFITVSRGGRVAPAKRETVELKKALMEERESKKREQMQKAGFYRFQGREKRKEEAEELVRRFEEDRKKVQALRDRKGKSGFRPEN